MSAVKLPFYARFAFILIILIAGTYICIIGQRLIVPLLFSFLFAILLLPVANYFENKVRLSRTLSSIIAVISLLVVISLIMYLLVSQITSLSSEWPLLKEQVALLFHNLQNSLANTFHVNLEKQTTYINSTTSNLLKSSGAILEKTVLSASSIILFLVFILIYTILLLFYRRLLMRLW